MISTAEMWVIGAALIMMCADVVAGFLSALVRHKVSSTKMRQGLLHKALLCVLILSVAALQVAAQRSGYDFGVPALQVVCGYICVMEFASVVENVAKGYPEFKNTKVWRLLTGGEEKENEK